MMYLRQVAKRVREDLRQYGPGVLAAALFLALMFAFIGGLCPVRAFLGIPCPGCGLTRSCLAILLFDFKTAATMNPAGFLWLPFLSALLICRYLLGQKLPFQLPLLILVCLGTILQWILRFETIMKIL